MKKGASLISFILSFWISYCQPTQSHPSIFIVIVSTENSQFLPHATVELLKDNKLIKAALTDSNGVARFEGISDGKYTFSISCTGYKQQITSPVNFPSLIGSTEIRMQPLISSLQEVKVIARKPFIETKEGKVILNIEASVTNIGATILEVLEKSPGVTVDKNGGISLQGKSGVLVMIDDKPTYLSGADLNNLLSSMNSSQVEQIELISNPGAKYDASGNAGIINIKSKKNKSKGFNGSFTATPAQGVYPKYGQNLSLNFRTGKYNCFLNYNMNLAKYYTDLYALRKYYYPNNDIASILEQPTYFKGNYVSNIIRTGIDYYLTSKTTIGLLFNGTFTDRNGDNTAKAIWYDPSYIVDSTILTDNKNKSWFRSGSANLHLAHNYNASSNISADVDFLHYKIQSEQHFSNNLLAAGGYSESARGAIPTTINIISGKVDYSLQTQANATLQLGAKSSYITTDNLASYQSFNDSLWEDDYTKSNHFIYKENINSLYTSYEKKFKKVTVQAGLRYENTSYTANQLGNVAQKDSSFSRNYGALFPSSHINFEIDSSNAISFSIGRRIDRPAFQNLNPFYFVINKYTYQTGNPFLLPQYGWNLDLSHQYKSLLATTLSFSVIKNYLAQLFTADSSKGVLLYSQGNVGRLYNVGLSSTLTVSPIKNWILTTQATYNYKKFKGFNGNNFSSEINQLSININNQLRFAKIYTAEIVGIYTTRSRVDIQELLYPTGYLTVGVSRPILKEKGTLKMSYRDIFYTNAMEGFTSFPDATEYFIIHRDSRVVTLSFTYRFGKLFKAIKHQSGADEEIERVGNGG